MAPGGEIYLEVPNLLGQIAAYQAGRIGERELVRLMYADQDYAENFHYAGFTQTILKSDLLTAGFENVRVQEYDLILEARALWFPFSEVTTFPRLITGDQT